MGLVMEEETPTMWHIRNVIIIVSEIYCLLIEIVYFGPSGSVYVLLLGIAAEPSVPYLCDCFG